MSFDSSKMLILKHSQVQPCELIHSNNGNIEKIAGISYEKRLFISKMKFQIENREDAINHCRKMLNEIEGKAGVLLVEDETHSTIWLENPQAKKIKSTQDTISRFNLDKVVAQMRTVGGVKIRNRNYRLKEYPYCFTGTEAVRWFMHTFHLSQAEALGLGQKLMDEKWFHHVADQHEFKDEDLFYRFYWDEE